MTKAEEDLRLPAKQGHRSPTWLPVLEGELKRRLGWADEVVSPFARQAHARASMARAPLRIREAA